MDLFGATSPMPCADPRPGSSFLEASVNTPHNELQAEIVSIGTELLLGEIVDTNASWIAGRLPALGIPLYRCTQIGDNRARLTEVLRAGWERANLLILTGGLGPTEDDLTREAIAELLGERMEVVPELERELREFFAGRGRTMPERNVKQATVIRSATALPNPIGTAPGWFVANGGRYIATMPGVPVEMRRMWEEQVVPRVLALPRGGAIVARTLKILGIGESAVEEQLGDLVHGSNPTVATYAKSDGIHVRLAARADDTEDARRLIAATEEHVRAIFGESIYGVDNESLATGLTRLLAARGLRCGVAERGLEGALAGTIAQQVLAGGLLLPALPDAQQGQAGEAEALALAERAARTFEAPVGIGALVVRHGDLDIEIAAAALVEGRRVAHAERYRIDPADGPRRAALLAVQLLRDALLAP